MLGLFIIVLFLSTKFIFTAAFVIGKYSPAKDSGSFGLYFLEKWFSNSGVHKTWKELIGDT